jgi:hypothetical protein
MTHFWYNTDLDEPKNHVPRIFPTEVRFVQLTPGSRRTGQPPAAQHILQVVDEVLPAGGRCKVLYLEHVRRRLDNLVRVLLVHVAPAVVGRRHFTARILEDQDKANYGL